MADELVRVIRDDEARVNVTWKQQNGDLPDPVFRDAAEGDVKGWVTEAVRNGGVPGIPADRDANFADFVVDRYPPTEARPYHLIQLRPKTAFGMAPGGYRPSDAPSTGVTQPSVRVQCCPHCHRPY